MSGTQFLVTLNWYNHQNIKIEVNISRGCVQTNATKLRDDRYDRVFLSVYAHFAFTNLFESHFFNPCVNMTL